MTSCQNLTLKKENIMDFDYLMSWIPFQMYRSIRRINMAFQTNFRFTYKRHDREMISIEMANKKICEMLKSNDPFMIARFGYTEAGILTYYLKSNGQNPHYNRKYMNSAFKNAGIFPYGEETLNVFCKEMCDSFSSVDSLASWRVPMFDYLENKCTNLKWYGEFGMLESFWAKEAPWTEGLAGKNVLVVHPFVESIKSQYARRELLFEDSRILPEFNLITYKAVQTVAGNRDERFDCWIQALEYMADEISKVDFDVAIIGCGAYGFPLAARIKRDMNKSAIHMGGATQLLFGITGNRWIGQAQYDALVNDYWVRPNKNERVCNMEKVEGGCYW